MVRARIMRDCWTGKYEIIFVGLDTGIIHAREDNLTLARATALTDTAGEYVAAEERAIARGEGWKTL